MSLQCGNQLEFEVPDDVYIPFHGIEDRVDEDGLAGFLAGDRVSRGG